MKLAEKYDQLIADFEAEKARIAHTSRAYYHEQQAAINRAGTAILTFEHKHGVIEGRHLVEHEKLVLPQLKQFEAMLEHYNAEPLPVDSSTATGDEIERATSERSALVLEVKKSIKTLSRMRDDIVTRRKAIGAEALELASRRDPLSGYERTVFTDIFNADRATREALGMITKPELAIA